MLKIRNMVVNYGPITALRGIEMTVNEGELVALVGANGAGKTTTLNAISGALNIAEGEIIYKKENLANLKTEEIVRKRILQVPEGRRVFRGLTVEENLLVGATPWYSGLRDGGERSRQLKGVYGIFPKLEERRKQLAWSLSGGEQQMLALGRALMGKPEMLLLDEPSLGLAPIIKKEVFRQIEKLRERGLTMLLVEQDAKTALRISDRAYVLDLGKVTLEGAGKELLADERVKKAYLGS